MKLLLDVGNTRVKWGCLIETGILTGRGAVAHRGVDAPVWTAALPAAQPPSRIIAANVAGMAVSAALDSWAERSFGCKVEYVRSARRAGGITNAYADPSLLGVDRWLGMIGVRTHCEQAFLLAAAGTAFTIDLVDEAGMHRGGLIAPGRSLMIETLKQKTGNIASAAAAADPISDGMFGLNTSAAIESGASHALAGLLGRAIEFASGRLAPLRLFAHGGDSGDILELVAARGVRIGVPTCFEPAADVVLLGLAALAEAGDIV
jgi:type III pantothenate kinase